MKTTPVVNPPHSPSLKINAFQTSYCSGCIKVFSNPAFSLKLFLGLFYANLIFLFFSKGN